MTEHTLPEGLVRVGESPRFTQDTLPEAITNNHLLKAGRWGVLNLHAGRVWFIDIDKNQEQPLQAPAQWVIAPELVHKLRFEAPFELHLEFFQADSSDAGSDA